MTSVDLILAMMIGGSVGLALVLVTAVVVRVLS